MARVTSKLQVTIPKVIAERYGIEPGQEIEWLPAGDAIRVVPQGYAERKPDRERRLALFRQATERQRQREATRPPIKRWSADRGWKREDLYQRGGSG